MKFFKTDEDRLESLQRKEKQLKDRMAKRKSKETKKDGERYYLGHRISF